MKNSLLYWLGIPGAIVACVTAVYAATDYMGVRPVMVRELNKLETVVSANQQGVQLIQWQILDQRRKTKGLSPSDMVIYCRLSKELGFAGKGCSK